MNIGIHAHVHNPELLPEFYAYCAHFPAPFDLYLTLTNAAATACARQLFTANTMPTLQQLHVMEVENRGRDIAPWVLGMRPYQAQYDLFCHVHGKQSPHFDFGERWRRYLLDNLIGSAAAREILACFAEQPDLGCVFPPIFPELKDFMLELRIPPTGLAGELQMAERLLMRMGLCGEILRSEVFFSAGTMYWYRPEALHQLFEVDIRQEDFSPEPIDVEGTLGHAIERLPALLCERNGYAARTYIHEDQHK